MTAPNLPRVRELIEQLEEEIDRLITEGVINHRDKTLPLDIREKLLVMGASIDDYVFWIRRRAQPSDLGDKPEDQKWWAEEMEAATGAWGITPREAMHEYFR